MATGTAAIFTLEPIVRGPVTPQLQREPLSKCIIDRLFLTTDTYKKTGRGFGLSTRMFPLPKNKVRGWQKRRCDHFSQAQTSIGRVHTNYHNISLPRRKHRLELLSAFLRTTPLKALFAHSEAPSQAAINKSPLQAPDQDKKLKSCLQVQTRRLHFQRRYLSFHRVHTYLEIGASLFKTHLETNLSGASLCASCSTANVQAGKARRLHHQSRCPWVKHNRHTSTRLQRYHST